MLENASQGITHAILLHCSSFGMYHRGCTPSHRVATLIDTIWAYGPSIRSVTNTSCRDGGREFSKAGEGRATKCIVARKCYTDLPFIRIV